MDWESITFDDVRSFTYSMEFPGRQSGACCEFRAAGKVHSEVMLFGQKRCQDTLRVVRLGYA